MSPAEDPRAASASDSKPSDAPRGECAWRDAATAYVLGSLESAEALAFAEHAPRCSACTAELTAASRVVAQVDWAVSETLPLEVDAHGASRVREQLLNWITGERERAAVADADVLDRKWRRWDGAAVEGADQFAPGLHNVPASSGAWEPIGIPGIEVKRLSVDARRRTVTMLVRMGPGTSYPSHRHAAAEECYVISGDLRVEGRTFHAGDYQLGAEGSVHGVQSTVGGCTLFISSSQDDVLV